MEDSVSTTNERDLRTVAFRAPERFVAALEQLANREMCSMSYIARAAVLKELREHGLLEPAVA
jgi:predicted transcriptional regulator